MPAQGDALCPQPAPAGCSACWMIRSNLSFNTFATLVTQSGRFERSEPLLELLPDGRMRKGIATIDLNDGHVDAFVLRLPRGREVPSEVRTCRGATVLGLFTRDCRSAVPSLRKRPSRPRPAFFNSTRITCARIVDSRRIRSAFICRWCGPFWPPKSRTVVSRNH